MNVSGIWDNIFRWRKKDKVEKDIIEVIKNIEIFEDLSPRELHNIVKIAYVRHYEPSEVIIREGHSAAGMYIIMKGEVEVSKEPKDGIKTVLTNLKEYDIFGDVGLVDNSPRTATVTATTSTDVIGFFRPELLKLINEDPKTASKLILKIAQIMAKRLRYTNERLKKAVEEIDRLKSMLPEEDEDNMNNAIE